MTTETKKGGLGLDPFSRYIGRLLSDLESRSFRRSGSAAIALGAFARLGRLDEEVPRVARLLARVIKSDMLDELDLWLCSAALRKVVCSKPAECEDCVDTLWELMRHRSNFVVKDVALALTCLDRAGLHMVRGVAGVQPESNQAAAVNDQEPLHLEDPAPDVPGNSGNLPGLVCLSKNGTPAWRRGRSRGAPV